MSSFSKYVGNGAQTVFAVTQPMPSYSALEVSLDGLVETTGFTYNRTNATVTFAVAPADGVVVKLSRVTQVEPIHKFATGAAFTARNVDTNFTQESYRVEELQANVVGVKELEESVLQASEDAETALTQLLASSTDYIQVGTFAAGYGSLQTIQQTLLHSDGHRYGWTGSFPKTVPAGSTPTPLGSGGWIDRSDVTLRGELAENDGASLIGCATYLGISEYAGANSRIYCVGASNIFDKGHGLFARDDTDTASLAVYGMIIIDALGRRWKRVFNGPLQLTWFGDVADAVSAFDNVFAYISRLTSPGYNENGQRIRKITIDLGGELWLTSRSIIPPQQTSGVHWYNGQIQAKTGFTGDFVIDIDDSSGLRVHHYHTFDELVIDGNFVASCMRCNRYLRIGISNCHFVQWKSGGHGLLDGTYWTEGAERSEGHEMSLGGNVTFTQYSFDKVFAGAIASGVAIEKNTVDGQYDGIIIASAGRGIVINRTLNRLQNIHIYGLAEKDYGLYYAASMNGTYLQPLNVYFDGCSATIVNPNYGDLSHCTFLNNTTPIIFETDTVGFSIGSAFTISNNVYNCPASAGVFNEVTLRAKPGSSGSFLASSNTMQHFGCQYLILSSNPTKWPDYVATSAGTVLLKNATGAVSVDLSPYMKQRGSNNASWPVAFFKVIANWQSTSNSTWGIYTVAVMSTPSASGYVAKVVGFEGSGLQTGFLVAPAVSSDGVLTATADNFFRISVVREDNRNFL